MDWAEHWSCGPQLVDDAKFYTWKKYNERFGVCLKRTTSNGEKAKSTSE